MSSAATTPIRRGDEDRKPSSGGRGGGTSEVGGGDEDMEHVGMDEEGSETSGANAGTARLKTYIKPRIPSTQEVLDRRSRKNAQSRARAAKLRQRIIDIENKPADQRTEEEQHLFQQYENRRRRKNDRSRERALEKKEEIDRILAKPEKKRTKIEKQFLETALSAKKRKNEGDRLRRQRLKELGLSTKGTGIKPGVSARGPLPQHYQAPGHHPHQHMYHPHMMHMGHPGEIPMSPMPSMPPHYGHYPHSPGTFASPGMMANMGFSPQGRRPGGPPGTPGRHEHMPYMPPHPGYDAHSPPRHPPPSRVEQRRNPDGSMSIQIGGQGGTQRGAPGGPPFGGEVSRMPGADEMAEVSGMINEGGYGEGEDADQGHEGKAD